MNLRSLALAVVVITGLVSGGCGKKEAAPVETPKPVLIGRIETDKGVVELELLPAIAPKAVENFRLLSDRGYYDGVKVFRIVKDFMVQTGDPQNDGKGGQSAWGTPFADEIDPKSPLYRGGYKRGTVAMANAGKNTNTSQFFIVQKDFPLPPDYTIFGRVTRGMEVIDAMMDLPMKRGIDGGMTMPVDMPVLKKVRVTSGTQ